MLDALPHADIWGPMLGAILTGAAIGFEREVTAKSAGLRTHTLVCFSSALLMMAASWQTEWVFHTLPEASIVSDPTRMAHGILTGIGFLGAGVIFRQGASVRGLTTAASVWMTAALGVLYGVGLMWLAVAGTLTTLVVLVIFRLFQLVIPDRVEVQVDIACAGTADTGRITAVMGAHAVKVGSVAWKRAVTGTPRLQVSARVWLRNLDAARDLDAALGDVPGLTSLAIAPVSETARITW